MFVSDSAHSRTPLARQVLGVHMKWTAALFLLVLPSSLCAQRANRPIRPVDVNSTSDLTSIDMFPTGTVPAVHATVPGKPVSVNELLISPKAMKELQRSVKAFNAHDLRGSNGHLEKALLIAPDLWQARFDLGGNYVRLGEYEKGLAEFKKAAEINENIPQVHHGLSVTLYFLQRYTEAEASARRAVELNPDSLDFRYMLARTIIAKGRVTPEAKELLQQSAAKFPNANLVLAQLLLNEGKVDQVVAELNAYLQTPDNVNRPQAECWLALLNGAATGSCATQKTFPAFR